MPAGCVRSLRPIFVIALCAAVALAWGCGGGGSAGGARILGGGSTGPSTGLGPPADPMLYVLMTPDNPTGTPAPESISAARIDAAGALVPLPSPIATHGTGDQNRSHSGFAVSADRRFLFVGHNLSDAVEAFASRTDGTLVAVSPTAGVLGASYIGVHPTRPVIYVTRYKASPPTSMVDVMMYSQSGALAPLQALSVAESVRGIALDPTGRYLAMAHMFGAGTGVAIYLLDPSGTPAPGALQSVPLSGGRPAAVTYDRTGTRLYVRDLDRGIYAFSVGAQGTITALNNGTPYPVGGFPSDFVAHPTIDMLYVLTAFTSEIKPFRIEPSGTLSAEPPVALNDNCQHMAIARTGRALFLTSRAQSRVHAFTIQATGTLTPVVGSPFSFTNPAGGTGAIVVSE